MSNAIILPPLPLPHFGAPWNPPLLFTEEQLRARDLEVAMAVLEGAAQAYEAETYTWVAWPQAGAARRKGSKAIRTLEVKHHE